MAWRREWLAPPPSESGLNGSLKKLWNGVKWGCVVSRLAYLSLARVERFLQEWMEWDGVGGVVPRKADVPERPEDAEPPRGQEPQRLENALPQRIENTFPESPEDVK